MPEERQEFIVVSWQKKFPNRLRSELLSRPDAQSPECPDCLQCGYLESTFLYRTAVLGKIYEVSEKLKCDVNNLVGRQHERNMIPCLLAFPSAIDQGHHARHQILAVQGALEEHFAQGDPDVGVVGAAAEERLLPHQQHELLQHREPSLKWLHPDRSKCSVNELVSVGRVDDDVVRTQTSFPPVVARFRGCRFSDNSDVQVTLYVEEIAGSAKVS